MLRSIALLVCTMPLLTVAAEVDQIPSALRPENSTHPGHSMQGETFDEGPRRSATLLGNTGRVVFPITTANPLVQQFFNQGIGQLHGFWYFEAERSFRQAAKLDPDCAMNYLGMALANTNNEKRAKGFIAEAVKHKARASDREKKYIDALDAWYRAEVGDEKKKKKRAKDFVQAMEDILFQYPDDLEAKAMLCLTLWQKRSDLEGGSDFALDALMNAVLAVNPYHPVHHFRVHLWDNDKAKLAVNSAERCGLSAPGIAHMWHMSGHTYSELHQYFDAAWHQEASARTDHAYMMRDGVFPDRIHNFAHNNEWLVKNLQYLGRIHDAIQLAKNTIELPRHPTLNPFPGSKSAHFGRLRLFQIYTQFELWERLIADAQTTALGPTADETEQIKHFRHLGRAYFRSHHVPQGRNLLALLENRLRCVQQEAELAMDTAEAKSRFEGADAKAIESSRNQAKRGTAEKLKNLERATDELHGYLLLEDGKLTDALARFEKAHDVDEAFLADVEFRAGKIDEALKRLREWVDRSKNQARPLAALIEMQWRQGKKDEAKQTLQSLREISGAIDLDIPPFARIASIASELGFATDWRLPKPVARNAAELPALSSLGPIQWQPSLAPDWSLEDGNGQLHALSNDRGKPLIVIFYLGAGCLHCAEQLQAFAPKHQAFAEQGISLVAISTDDVKSLKKARDRYKSTETFPFQLLSDSSLETFKRYQAFDDFENVPLHATYLIDAEGRMRWHDIGAEPFMNVEFLLGESKRLLDPNRIDAPVEPRLRDQNVPADALAPRNVFPPTSTPPQKPVAPARAEVAVGA